MTDKTNNKAKEKKRESIFLNEKFMAAISAFIAAAGLISLVFFHRGSDPFTIFELMVKLVTAVAMYFAFRSFKWDVAKGLMGAVLFCLMYQEGYLVLAKLWWGQDFDTYLVAGVQGSLYLAAAGMSFLMTIIITINHYFINYAFKGNPKNVILNRISIIFKLAVYVLLLTANSGLGLSPLMLWKNVLQYLTDIAVLLLVISIESQFDSFKILRQELLAAKRSGGKDR